MSNSPSISFDHTSQQLLHDPEAAAGYLEMCLQEGDMELFKLALKQVAEARLGGMSALAKETELNREALYRSLSEKGNPRFDTLNKVLHAVGLRIAVTPITTQSH